MQKGPGIDIIGVEKVLSLGKEERYGLDMRGLWEETIHRE